MGEGGGNAGDDSDDVHTRAPDAIEPVYPVETALATLTGGEAIATVREAIAVWNGAQSAAETFGDITQSVEHYFGGQPERAFRNDDGDLILMGNGRKVRFDINDPHGYDPHFHIEEELSRFCGHSFKP